MEVSCANCVEPTLELPVRSRTRPPALMGKKERIVSEGELSIRVVPPAREYQSLLAPRELGAGSDFFVNLQMGIRTGTRRDRKNLGKGEEDG